ncbi:MAG: Rap1a/Tai family immunity protein [Woeseiaceae bacterium]
MMQKAWWCAVGTLLVLATLQDARAVEALSTEELIEHCAVYEDDPDGEDGIFCVRYIQGFIDGAVATDERVTYNIADELDSEESFTERAIRTRVGSRIERFGSSYYAEFCLGEPLPLAAVVQVIVTDLMKLKNLEGRELARDVVYETLRRHYPCQADD